MVAEGVERPHGPFLHRVDESHAIDELALGGGNGLIEFGEIFGRDGEVGIEDHEDVSLCGIVAFADGIALALAVLAESLNVALPFVELLDLEDALPRVVGGVALDEDYLGMASHIGDSLDGLLDVAALIARE